MKTQAPVLKATRNLCSLLFATKEVPSTSCVFGNFGEGLMIEPSRTDLLAAGTGATLSDEGGSQCFD